MCLAPQSICHPKRIHVDLCPPGCFVAISMNFAVMPAAQGDRELITHPSSECSALRKSEVVRIGRTPAANQAGMSCDEFHMLAIANSSRLRMRRTAFFDPLEPCLSSDAGHWAQGGIAARHLRADRSIRRPHACARNLVLRYRLRGACFDGAPGVAAAAHSFGRGGNGGGHIRGAATAPMSFGPCCFIPLWYRSYSLELTKSSQQYDVIVMRNLGPKGEGADSSSSNMR